MTQPPQDIWILGATGRTGRAIATQLTQRGLNVVLVGREQTRLQSISNDLGSTIKVASLEQLQFEIASDKPAVVVNTIGPFESTAPKIGAACVAAGSHYVDIGNELSATLDILALDQQAKAMGSTLVTGAGFGVTATESLAVHLSQGQAPADALRVDAVPSVATEAGTVGAALAASIINGLPLGGLELVNGHLHTAPLLGKVRSLTTPAGDEVSTVTLPSGELVAAWKASGAAHVEAASSELPSHWALPLLMPLTGMVLSVPTLRTQAVRQLAAVELKAQPRPRQHSWAHAEGVWQGRTHEGWLRMGEDAMDITAQAAAEVSARLVMGQAQAGAYTPAALWGTELVLSLGGEFM